MCHSCNNEGGGTSVASEYDFIKFIESGRKKVGGRLIQSNLMITKMNKLCVAQD